MKKTTARRTGHLYFPQRITRAMKEIPHYALTIVEAPMGYGKTTALKAHLQDHEAPVLWLRINDSDTGSFWTGFCRTLAPLDPEGAQNLQLLGFPNDSVSRREAVSLLQEMGLPRDTVLVLDDYHLMNGTELDVFIEQLAVMEPHLLHIVLTARFIELPSLEELSLKGYLYRIPKELLEFKAEEIRDYYQLCGISLQMAQAERLQAYTEGWISAIYLLMVNYQMEGHFQTALNIYELVEKAVYLPFSDEIKDMLLRMAVHGSFSREMAAHMCGRDDVSILLDEVVNKSALVKFDKITKTYQIHTIFAGFLKDALEARGMTFARETYRRAAEWHMLSGEHLEAMHYFHLSGDFEGLMRAVEAGKGHSFYNEHRAQLIRYFQECPASIRQRHPVALLIYGLCLFSFNEMKLFEEACEQFLHAMEADETRGPAAKRNLMGEFELLRAFTEYNDIRKMRAQILKASALVEQSAEFIDIRADWTFGSPSVLYMFHRQPGELEREVQDMQEAMPHYIRLTGGHGTGGALMMEAEWHFYRGDLENAEILAHKAHYVSSRQHQFSIEVCAMFLQARIALVKGDFSAARNLHTNLLEETKRKKWYGQIHTTQLCEAFMNLELKQYERIPQWIREGDFNSSRILFPAMAFLNIVYGRVLLEEGEHLKLLGLAEEFIAIASVFPNLLGQIYTRIYMAAANERLFRDDEALSALQQALDMAVPDLLLMPFVENGDHLMPMLDRLSRRGCHTQAVARICDLYTRYREARDGIIQAHFVNRQPALADRELEIALLAAEGLSNRQIGERLFITENTVKTTLKRVFEKLGICSRVQIKEYFRANSADG